MDQTARRTLLDKAISVLNERDRLLVVTVEEFFDGNTDEQSIGVNLPAGKHIGLAGFRALLEGIRRRPDVQGIFIELTEVPDPEAEEDSDIWPTGCAAFVVTSAPLSDVAKWMEPLHPRDISEGWNVREGIRTPSIGDKLEGPMRPVRVWLL